MRVIGTEYDPVDKRVTFHCEVAMSSYTLAVDTPNGRYVGLFAKHATVKQVIGEVTFMKEIDTAEAKIELSYEGQRLNPDATLVVLGLDGWVKQCQLHVG